MNEHCMDDFKELFGKYGASPADFEEFLAIEANEAGDRGIIRVSEDIENIQRAILNEAESVSHWNTLVNHPFLTSYQVAVVSEYLNGEMMSQILTNKTEEATFRAIRQCDRLMTCALMAYDKKFRDPANGNRVISAMLDRSNEKIHELQSEMEQESSSPSMSM